MFLMTRDSVVKIKASYFLGEFMQTLFLFILSLMSEKICVWYRIHYHTLSCGGKRKVSPKEQGGGMNSQKQIKPQKLIFKKS